MLFCSRFQLPVENSPKAPIFRQQSFSFTITAFLGSHQPQQHIIL